MAAGEGARYSGLWKKDTVLSDPMDGACDAVELNWVLRRALGLLNYMEINDTDESFGTTVKAGGVMDVVERYPKSGEAVVHSRRDKRRGKHTGQLKQTEGGPAIVVHWDDPYSGWCSDTFSIVEGGSQLVVSTVMKMSSGQEVTYKTHYRRVRQD